jgi:two-component system sensor histidine kinase YesM
MKISLHYVNKMFSSISLRMRLIITYISFITIPIVFIGVSVYNLSNNVISSYAAENVYELIKKDNEIIDERLSKALDSSVSLIADKSLFNTINDMKPKDEEVVVKSDRVISNILSRYLMNLPGVYSYKLVTSYYSFSPDAGNTNPGFLPYKEFAGTSIYNAAVKAQGNAAWIPTYDFVKEYNQPDMAGMRMEGRYIFSMARVIDSLDFINGQVLHLHDDVERPILVIDYLPSFFIDIYEKSKIIKNSIYSVITKDGNVVTESKESKFNSDDRQEWLKLMNSNSSGFDYITLDEQPWILCYDTSKVTEWVTFVLVNPKELTSPLLEGIRIKSIYIACVLCLVSIIMAYFISIRVTGPINRLTKAAKKIGGGNFDVVLQEEGGVEFSQLIKTINNMSSEIKTLIKENYEVKLREKEAAIGALTLQLNPHFLYNTINIVNWIAIRNKQKEISKMLMSLSYMLNYTVRSKADIAAFRDDLEWLRQYLFIMSIRFEDKFTVVYDIDDEVLDIKVPKLFLQPIVENVFTHAFDSITSGGVVKISAKKEEDLVVFTVEDNGSGIMAEDIEKILNDSDMNDSFNIGVSNVNKRIKLIYGANYGIDIKSAFSKGTKVIISFPHG